MARAARGSMAGLLALFAFTDGAAAASDAVTTAVYAQTDGSYRRKKQPDGSPAREYYVMSNGGKLPGTLQDLPQRKLPFATLAGILAEHLARQNYYPAPKKEDAQLVLVVHWGATIPFNDVNYTTQVGAAGGSFARVQSVRRGSDGPVAGLNPANPLGGGEAGAADAPLHVLEEQFEQDMMMLMMENKDRDRANERNARLLGYLREINENNGIQRWAGGGDYFNDLRADIEEPRYYVVISAYDFRKTVEQKEAKLLWVTRVSVRAPGNDFADSIDAMIRSASKQFGRDSGRLLRQYEDRKGSVEVGEATVVGTISDEAVKERAKNKGRPEGAARK